MSEPRKWKGKPPADYVAVLGEDREWTLFLVAKTDRWWTLKLVAKEKQPYKANYELGYSPTENRFANKPAQHLLRAHRPELADWVASLVRQPQQPSTPAESKPAPEARDVDPERLLAIYKRLRESPDAPITAETHRQAEEEYGPDAPLALAELLESEVIYEHEGNDYIKEPNNGR